MKYYKNAHGSFFQRDTENFRWARLEINPEWKPDKGGWQGFQEISRNDFDIEVMRIQKELMDNFNSLETFFPVEDVEEYSDYTNL